MWLRCVGKSMIAVIWVERDWCWFRRFGLFVICDILQFRCFNWDYWSYGEAKRLVKEFGVKWYGGWDDQGTGMSWNNKWSEVKWMKMKSAKSWKLGGQNSIVPHPPFLPSSALLFSVFPSQTPTTLQQENLLWTKLHWKSPLVLKIARRWIISRGGHPQHNQLRACFFTLGHQTLYPIYNSTN